MPEVTAQTVEQFTAAVQAYLNKTIARFADGISWTDFGLAFEDLKTFAMTQVMSLAIEGLDKKEYVMQALTIFVNGISLTLPWYLQWAAPKVKAWFLLAARGSIESTLKLLKAALEAKTPPTPLVVTNAELAS